MAVPVLEHRNGLQMSDDALGGRHPMPIKSTTFPLIPLYLPQSQNLAGYFWVAYGYLIPFLVRIS